ncbi:metallothionein family protein [Pseudomonas palleroniana]|uniref:Metallothionein family protein n=1 Tax=Pseudomonas palleroniana TaxID=191390 RepID=A0A2L1J595_9PSED|nr:MULTISPECIES: metallothionein family protein [Pseudomonas]AVE03657.1 metallothionein family protein [Pseudomonas palleroniana]NCE85653.1 metallothionein family protein [Pseudomonas sp. Q1]
MSNTTHLGQCACATCQCDALADHQRDGKRYCSQACANLHPHGQPCPAADCLCESSVTLHERAISDSQLDEAIEETFPASDPISP